MYKGDLIWYKWGHKYTYYGVICDVGKHLGPPYSFIYADIYAADVRCAAKRRHNCTHSHRVGITHPGSIPVLISISKLKLAVDLRDKNYLLEKLLRR